MYRNSLKFACFLMISGCATFSRPDVKSGWDALQDAKSLDCRELPLMPEDLKIDRVRVLSSTGPSLFLEVSSRKGVRNFYHLAFRKMSNLEPSSLVKLPIAQDAQFLGAGISGKKAVFVVHTLVKDKPVIQVRDMTNNALLSEIPTKIKAFDLGDWVFKGDKLHALIRVDKDDEATDDQPYVELTVPLEGTKGLTAVTSKVIGNGAQTFDDAGGNRWTITLDRGLSASKKDPRFKISAWNSPAKSSAIEVDEKGPVESWKAFESPRGLSLAFIKGDSLLGESSSLQALSLSQTEPFSKQSGAEVVLSRVHVAQPILAGSPAETILFLPQWLDHEITVGAYRFGGAELLSLGFVGIFKEGTAFEEAFYHEPSQSYYLLSRSYNSSLAKYNLCEVDIER
ncbi:MAG: hypothetical protein V4655_05600 [Bdellovibrionota bacterium]